MVIELSTAFAMRCSDCGDLTIDEINIFQLSGAHKHDIFCQCGSKKAVINRKGSNYIEVKYYCIICDYDHNVIIPKNKFWATKAYHSLVCTNTDLNLGYYGSYGMIKDIIVKQQEELDSMANELGFDDFANPEVMLEILDYLHDIAARGDLHCECGSQNIFIDLSSDRVQLSCSYCNTTLVVPAAQKEDLINLKQNREIKLMINPGNKNNPKDPWINI